jgi:hypothetical protein
LIEKTCTVIIQSSLHYLIEYFRITTFSKPLKSPKKQMIKQKLILLPLLLLCAIVNAQTKPIATEILNREKTTVFAKNSSLFTVAKNNWQLTEALPKATLLDFNQTAASELINEQPENLDLSIPTANGMIELKLYRSRIFSDDFTVVTSDGKGAQSDNGIHYRGIINNNYSSIAAISIFPDQVMGFISTPENGNMLLGVLADNMKKQHVLYNEIDLHVPSGPVCSTPNDHGVYKPNDTQNMLASVNCVRIYWEANYDLYQNKGSNVTNVVNYLSGVFNQSSVLYANDGISVSLTQIFVWDTPSPYTATSTSSLLSQFQSYRNSYNGNIANLIGLAGGGGIAASIGGLCSSNIDYTQCYSGVSSYYYNVPTFSWTVEVVTHEQGHLLGSRHTHACVWNGNNTAIDGCGPAAGYAYEGSCTGAPIPSNGGTIMSYCHLVSAGINFSNGFGTQPKNVILNRINSGTCLSACTSPAACDVPTGMNTTSVNTTSANFNWLAASGAVSYNIQYRVTGTSTWSTGSSTTTSYVASNLTPGTTYEWQVQTVCSSGNSVYSSSASFTTQSACSTPTGMNTTSVNTSSATFNWIGATGAVTYNVQYRVTGTSTWSTGSSSTTSYVAGNLNPGTTYEWQVQTVCTSGNSGYSSSTVFTTQNLSCGVPATLNAAQITISGALVSWSLVGGATTYTLEYKKSADLTWMNIPGLTGTSYQLTGLISCTNYDFHVSANCSSVSGAYSATSTFKTTGCLSNYCTAGGTSTTREYINRVALGSINNTSGDNGGYADFTSLTTGLTGGSSYTISLTPGFHGGSTKEYWSVYIDYNGNGSFTDAGERIARGRSNNPMNFTFTVPSSALNGVTKMRILMKRGSYANPCDHYASGEVEDYTVNIAGNSNLQPALRTAEKELKTFLVYPNPVKDHLNIQFEATAGSAMFTAFDMSGKKVIGIKQQVADGTNNVEINTSELVAGFYILYIEVNNEVQRQKFLVE